MACVLEAALGFARLHGDLRLEFAQDLAGEVQSLHHQRSRDGLRRIVDDPDAMRSGVLSKETSTGS